MLPPCEICDPHVHFWSLATHEWLKGALDPDAPKPLRRFLPCAKDFWPEDYRKVMAPMTVTHAVYIQANMRLDSPLEEVAYMAGLGHTGLPTAFLTYAPLHRPDEAARVLDAATKYAGFRGVRFMLDIHPTRPELSQTDGDYMRLPAFRDGLRLVEERGLLFELQLCQCQLQEAAAFIQDFPNLTFVLNHAGFPLRGEFDEWHAGIKALASRPNVCVKIGGLGCYDRPNWDQYEITKYVTAVINAFGVERSMFASNLPVDLIDTTPHERYASFYAAVKDNFDAAEISSLFRDNALRCYRLERQKDEQN